MPTIRRHPLRFLHVAALLIGAALVFCLPSGASAADSEYRTLLAKAKAGESVDWTALRMAWTKDLSYTPLPSRGDADHAAMQKAIMADDMAAAKEAAAKAAEAHYIDVIPHVVLAMAADRSGDAETTARERAVAKGLFESL